MLKIDINGIDLAQVEALIEVTEQFIELADTLLTQGDISQKEYDSMTILKKDFLEDVKSKYL